MVFRIKPDFSGGQPRILVDSVYLKTGGA